MPFRSIVVAPGNASVTRVTSDGAVTIPIRRAGRFDELAEALTRRLGLSASVVEGDAPALGDDMLLVCRPDVLHDLWRERDSLPGVVAVDLERAEVVSFAERLGLAATIGADDYAAWVNGDREPPAIYGRRELAAAIGAAASTHPPHSGPRYARLTRAEGDLPALLGDYLAAYAAEYPGG